MKSEVQDDAQQPGKRASDVAPVDEPGKEPNDPLGVRSVGKEKMNLTGRAYEYFHKLQQ
jgi:hypothetical protein